MQKSFVLFVLLLTGSIHAQDRARGFRQLFEPRGVTLSKEQQAKISRIRERSLAGLRELQQQRNSVYTREQRQAIRKVGREAREAGKRGAELRRAIEAALKLTEEQKKKLADIQQKQRKLISTIQREVRAVLTPEQRRKLTGGNRRTPPTHANVKYGPHERNVMDVWLAKSDTSTPVLVSIHGGGFRGGNKGVDARLLKECLDSGISVVAITYRFSQHAIAPASFLDSARAIQFIRHNAEKWNLDSKRIASTGGSAGAGLSLWLGFHDDLAQPKSKDPIQRQSTRLTCMVVYNGQSSYDPRFIRKLFPDTDTYRHSALAQLYGVDLSKLDEVPKEKIKLFEEVSPIHHLSKGDAPALLIYRSKMETKITSQGIGIHHPRFGKVLKEKMDPLEIECKVMTGMQRGSQPWVEATMQFVKKHFKMSSQ